MLHIVRLDTFKFGSSRVFRKANAIIIIIIIIIIMNIVKF
jgi:hypothetical protein